MQSLGRSQRSLVLQNLPMMWKLDRKASSCWPARSAHQPSELQCHANGRSDHMALAQIPSACRTTCQPRNIAHLDLQTGACDLSLYQLVVQQRPLSGLSIHCESIILHSPNRNWQQLQEASELLYGLLTSHAMFCQDFRSYANPSSCSMPSMYMPYLVRDNKTAGAPGQGRAGRCCSE